MANLFQKLELAAFRAGITPRTQESRKWFQQKAGQLRGTSRLELMRQDPLQLRNRHGIGNMYMYFYDPKHKKLYHTMIGFPYYRK